MIHKVRIMLAEWLLQIVRAYFIGKTITFMTVLDGQPIFRNVGKVIGGVITRDATRMPTNMNLFVAQPGHSSTDLKRCPVSSIRRDKHVGWVSYD